MYLRDSNCEVDQGRCKRIEKNNAGPPLISPSRPFWDLPLKQFEFKWSKNEASHA